MNISRNVVTVCFVAMILWGSTVTVRGQEMLVSAGDSVVLPCSCSGDVASLVWQIGEDKIVNLYNTDGSIDMSYKDRTKLFLPNKDGDCSLLLHSVSLSDQKTFTCYVLDPKGNMVNSCKIRLNVQATKQTTTGYLPTSSTSEVIGPEEPERYTGTSIGVPFSIVALVILAGVILTLLIRCRRQRANTMVVVVDKQAGMPFMNHTPV